MSAIITPERPDTPDARILIAELDALLANGEVGICLKIASPQIEVNVWITKTEADALRNLQLRSPELKALRLGLSAGNGVHWSRDAKGRYYVLIGTDAETWDVGLTFDDMTFEAILTAIADPIP
jgi:hypothetical protein